MILDPAARQEMAAWRSDAVRTIIRSLARRGIEHAAVNEMVRRYREGEGLKEIAVAIGAPWPAVHEALFDLRRAGIALPKPKREG
ncbi:MAG: hypothetical protein U1E59_20290 [Amaricoccus sp.]